MCPSNRMRISLWRVERGGMKRWREFRGSMGFPHKGSFLLELHHILDTQGARPHHHPTVPVCGLMNRNTVLLTFMLLYGAASLIHFMHNAMYLALYPNLPPWLTPVGVLASWLVVGGTGAVGYWLFHRGSTVPGLIVIALYAALGFAGLDHYAVAPISAHSLAMNATIIGEVIAASALLIVTAWTAIRTSERPAAPTGPRP